MKYSIIVFFTATIIISSCNNEPKKVAETTDTDTTKVLENQAMIPTSTCYSSMTGKDIVMLKVEAFPNVVTGKLVYKLNEKDSNTG